MRHIRAYCDACMIDRSHMIVFPTLLRSRPCSNEVCFPRIYVKGSASMEDQSSSWYWMLAIILAVPIMAYMVGGWAHSKYESDWQSVLKEQYPYSSPASRSALTLSKVCQEPQVSNARLCKELGYLSLMRLGSVAAAILGLGLWAGIAFAAQQAAGNRERLLALFRPGLYLTIFGLIGLLSVQVALICATIYFGDTAATGGFHPFFIVAAALGGLWES